MTVNAIFLGGAKRVSMAEKFIEASRRLGIDLKIIGYELSENVALAKVADIVVGKRWNSPDIYDHLRSLYVDGAVNLIIPFVDGAVEVASMAVSMSRNLFAPVSSPEVTIKMFDKAAADIAFRDAGIPVPRVFPPSALSFPVIAKPRHGSASKGIVVAQTMQEWNNLSIFHADYLIQEYIANREEYTVDCYARVSDGEIMCVSPRQRLEVSGGEVVSTVTVDNERVSELAVVTLTRLNLRGAVTVQVIHDRNTDRYMVMEVNPRLGGGAVCAVHAGCDIPSMILSEAVGMPVSPATPKPGVLIQRYLSEISFQL